jgi:Zn-dependent M28 family amino/carboxypeptidase
VTRHCLIAVGLIPSLGFASSPEETAALLGIQATQSNEAYTELAELCDYYGARISGSDALERAIDWAVEAFEADGLAVRKEPVTVPRWVRGPASARVYGTVERDLRILALGGSVSTPKKGLRAPLVVVDNFAQLDSLGGEVAGKIVLYDVPFTTYGETVEYRRSGAARAAEHGAVAALIRSVSPTSLYTPHTGNMSLDDGIPPIPAAALTLEDSAWLNRLSKAGIPLEMYLNIQAKMEKDGLSYNVIAEIPGREIPEEIVVSSCHIDSWDVGQGAHDDGAGCVMVMDAARLIRALPLPPRRTTRFILYTNEENGLRGGSQYAAAHADELVNHVAAIEADTGAGRPYGLGLDLRLPEEEDRPKKIAEIIDSLAVLEQALKPYADPSEPILAPGFGGSDIWPLMAAGVLGLGLRHDMTDYWPIHHTEADTFDKIDPTLLARNTAHMAISTYLLAELDWAIPRERE